MRKLLFLLVLLPDAARADEIRIDFEQAALGAVPNNRLAVSSHGVDITFEGPELQVHDLFQFAGDPNVTGRALITWRWPQTEGITIRFSRPVNLVALRAGDWSSDDDGPLSLRAFDCDGTEIGSASSAWPITQNPPFARLEVQAKNICYAVYTSSGEHAGSTFIDDVAIGL